MVPSAPSTPPVAVDATGPAQTLVAILAAERRRLAAAEQAVPLARLRERAAGRERRDFIAALRASRGNASGLAIIAEIKQASPSRGLLRAELDVAAIARGYAAAGAAALSVLTEGPHFRGDLAYLRQARQACKLPILRKDFTVAEYQVWEAAANGADAVLLIVAILDDEQLPGLLATAAAAGMAALVEAHDAAELRRARAALAAAPGTQALVGVNNRDLRTFQVHPERALELASELPAGVVAVTESGLRTAADLRRAAAAGYGAALIGERCMAAPDPGAALAALLAEHG
ncbi:MAG: indole-3-glycerol phosphate synthase TrpC [Terriglobales bacterium]